MNIEMFKLDEYFDETQKYYYFFDGELKYRKELKKEVLKKVDIYESSYRSDRLKKCVKNDNRNILLDYFGYNKVDKEKQKSYERCISKIYYSTYFVQEDQMKDLIKEIDGYIEENNYLKPIFILFKIIGSTILINNIRIQKGTFKEDVSYLYSFLKTGYFSNEIYYLYLIMMNSYGQKVEHEALENEALKYPKISWLDYTFRGREAYTHRLNNDALLYWLNALNILKADFNFKRVLAITANMACIYNMQRLYQMSLGLTNDVIQYAYSQKVSKPVEYITNQYLYANYMLGLYETIDQFYHVIILDKTVLSEQAIMLIILTERKLGKLEEIEEVVLMAKKRDEEEIKYLLMMLEALDNIDKGKPINLDEFYNENCYATIKSEILKEKNKRKSV